MTNSHVLKEKARLFTRFFEVAPQAVAQSHTAGLTESRARQNPL